MAATANTRIARRHASAYHGRPSYSQASRAKGETLEAFARTSAKYSATAPTHSRATKGTARARADLPWPRNSDEPIELAGIRNAKEQNQIALRSNWPAIESGVRKLWRACIA